MGTSDKVAGKTKIVNNKVKEPVIKPAGVKQAPAGPKVDLPEVKAAASKPVKVTAASKIAAAKATVTKAALKVKDRAKK